MGIFDGLLQRMNLKSDDDYEEEDDVLEEEDDEAEDDYEPVKPIVKKTTKFSDSSYTEDEEPVRSYAKKPVKSPVSNTKTQMSNNKVVHYNRTSNMEVCVFKPNNIEDGREISDTLIEGKAVVLNLEGIDVGLAQRIIDFTSGATYSIRGNLQKISNYIFIVTPESVEISGDFQDLLSGNTDYSFNQGNMF